MISQISLENFKSFQNLSNLQIKPITVLCGTNSCGKSSILQSILLIKQTLERQTPHQALLLNGRFVRLGTFENIVFEKKLDKIVSFRFSFKFTSNDLRRSPGDVYETLRYLLPFGQRSEYYIHYEISIKTITDEQGTDYLKPVRLDKLRIKSEAVTSDGQVTPGRSLEISVTEDDVFSIEGIKDNVPNFFLRRINDLLQHIFSLYTYLGPLREEPSRRYIYEDEILEIGIRGENAAYIYLAEQDASVENDYYCSYNSHTDSFEMKFRATLAEAVQDWLAVMNIYAFKPEPTNEVIYLNLNSSTSSRTRVNIADVGFGVSQIFPIVLEGLRMPSGNTLMLEQPEIHLHPNLQMQMADFLISLAMSKKKVIVETHSDHIINRLVRRIVEDDTGQLKDLIAIYFIKPTENGSTYEEITIDETRGVINWPINFFDQTATEQEKIMQAGLKKRRKLRKRRVE